DARNPLPKGEGDTRNRLPKGEGENVGMAWVELSLGSFYAAVFPRNQLADQLARIQPAECLVEEQRGQPGNRLDSATLGSLGQKMVLTSRPAWSFSLQTATAALAKQFNTVTLEGFGFDHERDALALRAAGAVLEYLTETQRSSLAHLDR